VAKQTNKKEAARFKHIVQKEANPQPIGVRHCP
jgi:hypothetical protein